MAAHWAPPSLGFSRQEYWSGLPLWSLSVVSDSLWPVDCGPPGSSVHGVLQARILEWVAISFSRGSSQPRNRTHISRIAGRRFNLWATREAHAQKIAGRIFIKPLTEVDYVEGSVCSGTGAEIFIWAVQFVLTFFFFYFFKPCVGIAFPMKTNFLKRLKVSLELKKWKELVSVFVRKNIDFITY